MSYQYLKTNLLALDSGASAAHPLNLSEFPKMASALDKELRTLEKEGCRDRFWRKDAALWKKEEAHQAIIRNSLGWLDLAESMTGRVEDLERFAQEVRQAGFRHVVHMGMGGSSLAPLAFAHALPKSPEGLPLSVLDTTNPTFLLQLRNSIPLPETVFIVASKSGTTAEVSAFCEYFFGEVEKAKGSRAGENFVAITDPGTSLESLANQRHFRKVFRNFSDIGGRYSALSYFGLVPAVLMGVDIRTLLDRASRMQRACSASTPLDQNPGFVLGSLIGTMAKTGRNKLTFLTPPRLATFGLWLEQLIAESTGKEDTGILPVAGETPMDVTAYGRDRLFVDMRIRTEPNPEMDYAVRNLRQDGLPVLTIALEDRMDLGQEILRWEIATALAGKVLKINPFDQPNVQESKTNTNRLLEVVRATGSLPEELPSLVEAPLSVFAFPRAASIPQALRKFFQKAHPGDYAALLAYLPEDNATGALLQDLRLHIRNRLHIATTVGYGPRYLHSTGQFHKGGPNTGLFILLTADDAQDASIPGAPFSFGTLFQAQAAGDMQALREHGRRVMRIHLGGNIGVGMEALHLAITDALLKPLTPARKKSAPRKALAKPSISKSSNLKKKVNHSAAGRKKSPSQKKSVPSTSKKATKKVSSRKRAATAKPRSGSTKRR